MYRLIVKRQMKRVVLVVAVLTVLVVLTSCGGKSTSGQSTSGQSTMKGTTYVNSNAEKKPMFFMTETIGVLEFVDDKKVEILFPYAIDTKSIESPVSISSELWVSGEYERIGNKITISVKLTKDQEKPGIFEFQLQEDGKTLLGEQGRRFNKFDK